MAENEQLVADHEDTGGDDFEAALREFGEPTREPAEAEANPELKKGFDELAERRKLLDAYAVRAKAFEQREETLQRYQADLRFERDIHDAGRFFDTLAERIPGLSKDDIETLVTGLVNRAPELYESFKGRYRADSDWPRVSAKIEEHLMEISRRVPDQGASEDVAAVAHAVKGYGGKPPPAAPPDYNSLTDAEFGEKMRRDFGFSPRLD